jgi:hypothetical protein
MQYSIEQQITNSLQYKVVRHLTAAALHWSCTFLKQKLCKKRVALGIDYNIFILSISINWYSYQTVAAATKFYNTNIHGISFIFVYEPLTETDDSDIKIADFGFAKKTCKLLPNESACGTPG